MLVKLSQLLVRWQKRVDAYRIRKLKMENYKLKKDLNELQDRQNRLWKEGRSNSEEQRS